MCPETNNHLTMTNIELATPNPGSNAPDSDETRSILTDSTSKGKLSCSVISRDMWHHLRTMSRSIVVNRRVKRGCSPLNLVFFGFLLLTVLLPSSMSLPQTYGKRSSDRISYSDSSRSERSATDTPHWVNPCNGTSVSGERASSDESTDSDGIFIKAVKLTAKQARHQAEKFRDEYVLKMFGSTLKEHHNRFKESKYEWLNKVIPKDLGEPLSLDHLNKLSLDDEPLKIYGYLQRLAVAFEQLVLDHWKTNSLFKHEFAIAENNLRRILCEVRELIPDEKLIGFENAKRELMQDHLRHMDHLSDQYVRDWLIFRDYMNLVEYIEQVMEHFENKIVK